MSLKLLKCILGKGDKLPVTHRRAMPEVGKTPEIFRFGPFALSVETGELRKNGVRVPLAGQPIQVLILLVQSPGSLVTREDLKRLLWLGNTSGDFETGLNAAVNRLRDRLGDSATEPQYIETVPGRGYRFIGVPQSTGRAEDAKPGLLSPPVRLEDDPIAFLKVVRGPDLDRSFPLTRSMTHLLIGRSSDCDIVLKDHYSSRLHVTLTIESIHTGEEKPVQYVFTLICTGLNGVVVGDKEGKKVVHRLELRHGDYFRLAYNTFRFVVPDQPELSEPTLEPPKPPWWKRKVTIALGACIAIVGLLYPWVAPQIESYWRLRELQQLKVSAAHGIARMVSSPTFSPDGSQIAFVWWRVAIQPNISTCT